MTFALTDGAGNLREDGIRSYQADRHSTISGALMAFKDESGLTTLPRRCALAVAGVPRGDTISVTSSRWFISKSGLAAILQKPPLVINDFAANVWAVSASGPESIEPAGGPMPAQGPGTFAVIGMESGLGVAAFTRGDESLVTVLATEAGHSELIDLSPDMAPIIGFLRDRNRYCSAETLLSASGLAAIYNTLAEQQGITGRTEHGDDVIREAALGDGVASRAVGLFAKAVWRFAGNLTLIYGAWDGIFLTGSIVNALRDTLSQPEVRQSFAVTGPYANMLRTVPAGFFLLEHSALRGAAEAIRQQE